MRQIIHPGPIAAERMMAVPGEAIPMRFTLQQGCRIDEAISEGFRASGCIGGFVAFVGGKCEPFKYVIPAASPDGRHAAWYSDTFQPDGVVAIHHACAIVGIRDGGPFIHCHGVWSTREGLRMGHMLAPETFAAEPIDVSGIGLRTATFEAMPDGETNFILFEPVQVTGIGAGNSYVRAILAKVRPNEDISLAIEEICSTCDIGPATVYGIGSLNEVRFTDGTSIASHATEVLIRRGAVKDSDGHLEARLEVDVVDMGGNIHSGELVRGDNPVCVTFELVIAPA